MLMAIQYIDSPFHVTHDEEVPNDAGALPQIVISQVRAC